MFKKNNLFQYVPQKSIIHAIDPRVKIVLALDFLILIFLSKTVVSICFIFAFIIAVLFLTRINIKTYVYNLKPLLLLLTISCLINLIYGSAKSSFFILFRIVSLSLVNTALILTTTAMDLTDALQKLISPLKFFKVPIYDISTIMSISLRFIPTLFEESRKIMEAQKSRGAEFESRNIKKKIKAILSVLIPMFVASFRRADNLAVAMECRCYSPGEGKTKLKKFKISTLDYISIFVIILLNLGVIVCNKIKTL